MAGRAGGRLDLALRVGGIPKLRAPVDRETGKGRIGLLGLAGQSRQNRIPRGLAAAVENDHKRQRKISNKRITSRLHEMASNDFTVCRKGRMAKEWAILDRQPL